MRAAIDAGDDGVEHRERHAVELDENGPCAAIEVVTIASWLPRMWCIRSPSRPYAARNASYSCFGAAVGEVALHDDGVGVRARSSRRSLRGSSPRGTAYRPARRRRSGRPPRRCRCARTRPRRSGRRWRSRTSRPVARRDAAAS